MIAIKGEFDGQSIKLLESPPSTRAASVVVIFPSDEDGDASVVRIKDESAEYKVSASQSDLADIVDRVRLVLNASGKPAAVQMDIADWSELLNWLEDVEDVKVIRERFRERSKRTVTAWEDFEAEMKADGLL